jgi:RHS repeat-associated protein
MAGPAIQRAFNAPSSRTAAPGARRRPASRNGSRATRRRAYDALNRMTTVGENGATSGIGLLASYAYDPLSRRTGVARGNGTSSSYGYDAASRLTSLAQAMASGGTAANVTLSFGYTAANQISSQGSTNDAYDWLNHPAATVAKTFDGLNRDATIVAITGGYDGRGNVANDGVHTLTYDADNKLTSATLGSTTATLSYDPLGRLQQDVDTGGTSGTTVFLYEGQRLSAEYDGSGNLLRRYVHGPGTDEPIVWYEGAGTSDRRWLHADGRGSIIAWSNASGVVAQTQAYGPYGEPTSWGGSRFQYAGQIALPEVALYHDKAREYDPAAGRFLQTDPVGYGGGENLYRYASDDPIDLVDPMGTSGNGTNGNTGAPGAAYAGDPNGIRPPLPSAGQVFLGAGLVAGTILLQAVPGVGEAMDAVDLAVLGEGATTTAGVSTAGGTTATESVAVAATESVAAPTTQSVAAATESNAGRLASVSLPDGTPIDLNPNPYAGTNAIVGIPDIPPGLVGSALTDFTTPLSVSTNFEKIIVTIGAGAGLYDVYHNTK